MAKNGIPIGPNGKYILRGQSVAARQTGLYVEGLSMMLDCGISKSNLLMSGVSQKMDVLTMLITHGHWDHVKGLIDTLMDNEAVLHNSSEAPLPRIFCPNECVDFLRNHIGASFALTKGMDEPRIHHKYWLNGFLDGQNNQKKEDRILDLSPGQKIPIRFDKKDRKKPTLFAEIMPCRHTAPSIGYGIIEVKNKLCQDYSALQPNEIAALINTGTNVFEETEIPLFCFMGDTDETVLYSISGINTGRKQWRRIAKDIRSARKQKGPLDPHIEKLTKATFSGFPGSSGSFASSSCVPKEISSHGLDCDHNICDEIDQIDEIDQNECDDTKDIQNSFETSEPIYTFNTVFDKFPTMIIECTYLLPEHRGLALDNRHMHWNALEPYIRGHPNTTFILIHFSNRYAPKFIDDFFKKTPYKNVYPLVTSMSHEHKHQNRHEHKHEPKYEQK
ncbi:MAG: beta-lactamase superfamily domain [Terrestrivirus sp.]|uniref:Beta-lactamase superfamily domain n=1 Tax=Terrestrivirus sp. TaxID=2487775 RepID=A0A3G4ZTL1_9VIRU|nr:MAG: beta-lactamase superfamily domain [Terrestrivirus sp.]